MPWLMIYFVQAGDCGPIKIGFASTSALRRIKALQVGSAVLLVPLGQMEGTVEDEEKLHDLFGKHRILGEWFSVCDELLDYITNNCTAVTGFVRTVHPSRGGRRKLAEVVKVVNLKVPDSSRAAWVVAARNSGMNLSEWIRSVCDLASVDVGLVDVPIPTDQPTRFKRVQVQEVQDEPREPDTSHVKVRQPKASPPSAVLPRAKSAQTADQRAANVSALKEFLANR